VLEFSRAARRRGSQERPESLAKSYQGRLKRSVAKSAASPCYTAAMHWRSDRFLDPKHQEKLSGTTQLLQETVNVSKHPDRINSASAYREKSSSGIFDSVMSWGNSKNLTLVGSRVGKARERPASFTHDIFNVIVKIWKCILYEIDVFAEFGVPLLVLAQRSSELKILCQELRED